MSLHNLTHEELQTILNHLDHAIYNHQQWYNSLIRSFVCRIQPDDNDTDTDPHTKCRFGQWYYNHAPDKLVNHPGYIAIGEAHQYMHQQTALLLNKLKSGETIHPLEFDNFANSLEKLRLEIFTLKNELETLLYIHDPLTMAISRVNMLTMLREQHAFSLRNSSPCCIAMLDIDNFKNVNDEHGHTAGDKVLAAISQCIKKHLRPYDKLFRYGGEEFLICMPQTNLEEGLKIINRIRLEVFKQRTDIGNNKHAQVTISIGLTFLNPELPVEQSIDQADKAMYAAKMSGRNNCQVWTPTIEVPSSN